MHRVAMGVRGMLRDSDAVVDMGLVDPSRELLAVNELGYSESARRLTSTGCKAGAATASSR